MADDNSEDSGVGSEEIDDAEILEQLEQLNTDDDEGAKVTFAHAHFMCRSSV
jgi:hypothetical protein